MKKVLLSLVIIASVMFPSFVSADTYEYAYVLKDGFGGSSSMLIAKQNPYGDYDLQVVSYGIGCGILLENEQIVLGYNTFFNGIGDTIYVASGNSYDSCSVWDVDYLYDYQGNIGYGDFLYLKRAGFLTTTFSLTD